MSLVGARTNSSIDGLDPLPGTSSYLVGNDPRRWHTGIPTYGRVRYRAVYPGIDAIYYGKQRQLEYDLVVSPHADPKAIRLSFTSRGLHVQPNGDLELTLEGGNALLKRPVAYQEARGVRTRSQCDIGSPASQSWASISGTYDRRRSLVIDPMLSYSTYLGGIVAQGQAIAVDSSGNSYVTGWTNSFSDFPTT